MNFSHNVIQPASIIVLILASLVSYGQNWELKHLNPMPISTSNHAVASLDIGDTTFVFSFGGIDSTKEGEGIHSQSFRYNSVTDTWERIQDLPDSLGGVIAASASTVEGKVYIMGGYHVNKDQTEVSSYENRIYDPVLDSYTRGADIPIAIDDHVQVVYKHYIYLISGWTSTIDNGNNTNAVQIYNTRSNSWTSGTATPNTNRYKVFGASGTIKDNVIYYAGGARFFNNFPLTRVLRTGTINPQDPFEIQWRDINSPIDFRPYRSAMFWKGEHLFWMGGSQKSYNYDGVAYDGSGGVNPSNQIVNYHLRFDEWSNDTISEELPMDLRGWAALKDGSIILCGGMARDQMVDKKVYHLSFKEVLSTKETKAKPTIQALDYQIRDGILKIKNQDVQCLKLVNSHGQVQTLSYDNSISIRESPPGVYWLLGYYSNGEIISTRVGWIR